MRTNADDEVSMVYNALGIRFQTEVDGFGVRKGMQNSSFQFFMFSDYYLVVSGFNHLPTTHLVTLNHFVSRKVPSSVNGFAYYIVLVATVKVPHDTSGVQICRKRV